MPSRDFSPEFFFKSSKSSGKGGQHVNKVESRVSLFFNVEASQLLTAEEKQKLKQSTELSLSKDYVLQIDVEESRSQIRNKTRCIEKFHALIAKALRPKKVRKATKPSKASIRKRLELKKRQSEKKKNRKTNF